MIQCLQRWKNIRAFRWCLSARCANDPFYIVSPELLQLGIIKMDVTDTKQAPIMIDWCLPCSVRSSSLENSLLVGWGGHASFTWKLDIVPACTQMWSNQLRTSSLLLPNIKRGVLISSTATLTTVLTPSWSLLCSLNMQDEKINLKLNQSNLLNQLIMHFRVREQGCLRSVCLVKRLHCEPFFTFIFEPGQPNSFPHNFSTHLTMERPIKDNCNKCGIRFSLSFHELI